MSIAKRLEELVREARFPEAQADEILETREALWSGKEKNGQMLLALDEGREKTKTKEARQRE